jgi:hypothetical protein
MYSTTVYLYQQKQQVILIDTSGDLNNRRWEPVYTKNLKINKGVDNVILFEFINQDQKPVDITGSTITFRLISHTGNELLLTKDLVTLSATSGRAKVTLTSVDTDNLHSQLASWSLSRASGVLNEPVFTDAYSGGRGQVDIVDSVFPNVQVSQPMTIPTDHYMIGKDNLNRQHTSAVDVTGKNLVTFQFGFDHFTGNIKPQGSNSLLGPWFDIGDATAYSDQYSSDIISVQNTWRYLRFEINQFGGMATLTADVVDGVITTIHINGEGSQWLGNAARINIKGIGTGASAVGTIVNGGLAGINLISGGAGYVVAPKVTADNGAITKIIYR